MGRRRGLGIALAQRSAPTAAKQPDRLAVANQLLTNVGDHGDHGDMTSYGQLHPKRRSYSSNIPKSNRAPYLASPEPSKSCPSCGDGPWRVHEGKLNGSAPCPYRTGGLTGAPGGRGEGGRRRRGRIIIKKAMRQFTSQPAPNFQEQ